MKTHFIALLEKYLNNTCLPSEKDEFFAMLNNPEYEDLLNEKMWESWNHPENVQDPPLAVSNELLQKINGRKSAHLKVSRQTTIKHKWPWVAAAFVFFTSLPLTLFLSGEADITTQEDWVTYSADIGERRYIVLPDSSEVWLNSGSTVRFPLEFEVRKVLLTGEAFFEVRRDTLHPFSVRTGGIVTQVMGTSFNIRSFDEEPAVKITVNTGKVGVGKDKLPFASLLPDQQISYQKNAGDFSFNEVDAASLSSWKEGNLVFENITFAEAAVTLQNHFGVGVHFQNENLKNCRFTAKFDMEEDLGHVLEVLTKLNGISVRSKNGDIYFIGTKCL